MVKWISILLFFCLPFATVAQTIDLNKGADKAFDELFSISGNRHPRVSEYTFLDDSLKREVNKWEEINVIRFREQGLRLWDAFKTDNRRYDWFFQNIYHEWLNLHYWQNIDSGIRAHFSEGDKSMYKSYASPINWQKLQAWERRYPQMKKEYFAYLNATKNEEEIFNQKNHVLVKELESFLKLSLNKEYRHNKKIDLQRLSKLFRNVATLITDYETKNSSKLDQGQLVNIGVGFKRALDNDFLACYDQFGLTSKDIIGFINSLKSDNNPIVVEWALQRGSLFALKQHPMQLKGTAIDGRKIDLEKLRGKVVLVDIWSTVCSSCIARMPAIKQVYDKYKADGFEVISLCCNGEDELNTIRQIEKKINADWPILLGGGVLSHDMTPAKSLAGELFKKYGFFGVPQLLLLDKQGKLVLLNDILRFGDFEPIVKKLLEG